MQMLLDQTGRAAEEPMDKVDAGLEEEYRRTMY
jgi:hypothetical protein